MPLSKKSKTKHKFLKSIYTNTYGHIYMNNTYFACYFHLQVWLLFCGIVVDTFEFQINSTSKE